MDEDAEAGRRLQVAAIGMGVDSVAMAVEMTSRGDPIDLALMADTGSEFPETYEYVLTFAEWCARKGIEFHLLPRYEAKDLKGAPAYRGLEEECVTYATLPMKVFGPGACSIKHKQDAQHNFIRRWEPAQREWAENRKVVRLVGFDTSPADGRRYGKLKSTAEQFYENRYPLREWGWTREDCVRRIQAEGLAVPRKSSCYFCPCVKPHEVDAMPPRLLRRIALIEGRAAPRLSASVQGLWRRPVLGMRGAVPKPGSITEYVVARGLLEAWEVEAIRGAACHAMAAWREAVVAGGASIETRPTVTQWIEAFDRAGDAGFDAMSIEGLRTVGFEVKKRMGSE